MSFLEHLKTMTDDELLAALVTCDTSILVFVKQEWNKRHPEDPVKI